MKHEETQVVKGYYFYDYDKFIQSEAEAVKFSAAKYNEILFKLLKDEKCVCSEWGIEELAILLNKSVYHLIDNKIVSGIEAPKKIQFEKDLPKNTFKTVTERELNSHTRQAVEHFKQRLIEQISRELVDPRKLKTELERQKKESTSETESRSILNQLNAVNSEIHAYHTVLNMLK